MFFLQNYLNPFIKREEGELTGGLVFMVVTVAKHPLSWGTPYQGDNRSNKQGEESSCSLGQVSGSVVRSLVLFAGARMKL
jgi:hypothetical protein